MATIPFTATPVSRLLALVTVPCTMTSGLVIVPLSAGDVIVNVICGVTIIVILSVALPLGPVAVMVYVVGSMGETVVDPLRATLPIS